MHTPSATKVSIGDAGVFSLPFTVPSDAALGATQLRFSPICQHSAHIPLATFTVTPGPSRTSAPAAASNLTITAVDAHDAGQISRHTG